ncbi:hypothetical protein MRY87_02065 [bacterium]|nr:hypothetical protein [bacterium]
MTEDEKVDGTKVAAEILKRMDGPAQTRIVANIEAAAPELAEKIQENLFRFDDIAELPDRGVQVLVQSVNHHDLVLSLKTAAPTTKQRILENVSERKKNLIAADEASQGPIKLSEVESAQKRILNTLDELRSSGKVRTGSSHDIWV